MRSPVVQVVFLGVGTEADDRGFARLQQELKARHARLASRVRLTFFAVDNSSPAQVQVRKAVIDISPQLIVAPNGHLAAAARAGAPQTPLVFGTFADPVAEGVVTSMQPRAEPATGVWVANDLDGKRLEILRDAYPGIRTVGVLGDRGWARAARAASTLVDVAQRLGLAIKIMPAESPAEALATLRQPLAATFDAWYLPRSSATLGNIEPLISHFRALRKPVILSDTAAVIAGAPLSYAVDTSFAWPAIADLSARVLEGEHAGEIPVERPPRFILAIRTGSETGLPPPSIHVVRRADVVIR